MTDRWADVPGAPGRIARDGDLRALSGWRRRSKAEGGYDRGL